MTRKDYIEKINQNLEHLTKDELKDVSILTTAQYGVRLKVAEKEYIEKEIANLTPQLQQQALPVVPDFIGKLINAFGTPEDGRYINYSASYLENQKELDWIDNHQKTWLTALLVGFTVEKPQLFYLKNKLTTSYLILDTSTGYFEHWGSTEATGRYKSEFTQQEIDSMQT
ncbi:DUF1642 domain-containing protein, partial [Lactococcus lactis]|uniref:DUF1642 domain-containing protein n=1 Tax=Lactococcus lactis TaxID=1358 RepID=UPI00223B9FAD